jgi:D-glycero-alpha-D-manno-heptose-7-phosphate kinase
MLIKCTAPIRICDLGGWTDTWFADTGKVLNIAVFPCVEVTVRASRLSGDEPQITIHAENYQDSYSIKRHARNWSRHPLIEAAFRVFDLPTDVRLEVVIFSEAPAGASTGTSAAVSVAILGALDLVRSGRLTSHEIARKAHYVETEILKYQSGIQDQLSSAYGGVNFIEMRRYPDASVSPIYLPDPFMWELESRLLLIYLGRPHSSSEVHQSVIGRLEKSPRYRRCLEPLRQAAEAGKEALLAQDLESFGLAMVQNTEAQRKLHPDLVGERAQQVINVAKKYGVSGYKVNGAGGVGGSVTLLLEEDTSQKHALIKAIEAVNPDFKNIPVRLAPHGLRRWKVTE